MNDHLPSLILFCIGLGFNIQSPFLLVCLHTVRSMESYGLCAWTSLQTLCEMWSGGASGAGPHLGCCSGFHWQAPSLSHVYISCFLRLVTSHECEGQCHPFCWSGSSQQSMALGQSFCSSHWSQDPSFGGLSLKPAGGRVSPDPWRASRSPRVLGLSPGSSPYSCSYSPSSDFISTSFSKTNANLVKTAWFLLLYNQNYVIQQVTIQEKSER